MSRSLRQSDRSHIKPQRKWGQHFLINPHVRDRILKACHLKPDETVLEIGPGLGALTEGLIPQVKKVYAIEPDKRFYDTLCRRFDSDKFVLIRDDFLKYDLMDLPSHLKCLGNLPYNISTPILEKVMANRARMGTCFFTVQHEFGKRLAARPFCKDYGALSCYVQYSCDVKLLFTIGRSAFRPAPKVTSCLVQLSFKKPSPRAKDEKLLFHIIRHAFQQRRKKIANALYPFVAKETLRAVLPKSPIQETQRPDQITLKDYVILSDLISDTREKETGEKGREER